MNNFWNKWNKHIGHVKGNEETVKLGGYFSVPILDNKVLLVSFNSSIYDDKN